MPKQIAYLKMFASLLAPGEASLFLSVAEISGSTLQSSLKAVLVWGLGICIASGFCQSIIVKEICLQVKQIFSLIKLVFKGM